LSIIKEGGDRFVDIRWFYAHSFFLKAVKPRSEGSEKGEMFRHMPEMVFLLRWCCRALPGRGIVLSA